MACTKIKTKKYQTRKGPPYHAKDCKGQTKKGNNKKNYISTADKHGVYKWIQKGVSSKKKTVTLKKKGIKMYKIIDNYAEPFVVDVSPSQVEIYKQRYVEDGEKGTYERDKRLITIPYHKIFLGDNQLKAKEYASKGKFPGNSILLQTGNGKYIYIGSEIYFLETKDGELIKEFYSPVGNNAVSYPYAVGENHTYFMLDKQTVPNNLLDLKKDAYGQFYGFIKNEDKKKEIESSKKKFKTKMMHKRHMP